MRPAFSAIVDGALIRCSITADRDLASPVFCLSLFAPALVAEGGTLLRQDGGYTEVRLPDLTAGLPHSVVLRYEAAGFRPANRAWLPLGPYLRHAGGTLALPPLPAGVRDAAEAGRTSFDGLRLVPPPTGWQPDGGTVRITTLAGDAEPLRAADALARRTGLSALLAPDGLPLETRTDASLPADGYILEIGTDRIVLTAPDRGGLFYGAITLLTLRQTHDGQLPTGGVTDAPRFGWRGQHLDCARHFYQIATIERLLDLMALFKLNRFHWHFADDEAFRLEVDCAPDLWRQTAFRGEGELVPGVFGGGIRSGGSYSKAEARALIERARGLNIEILPEIEVPAHALALNRAIAGLRDPADSGDERSVQGYGQNVVNPALPATWNLLDALALEVADLFPFRHLHLGGDELPPDTWAGSPEVDALKAREGLATRDDVQGWTMARLAARLAAHGIRPAAWEEAARGSQGGIGHDALVFSWTGQGPGIAAARAGHEVVMCPAQHIYFDMAHSADPDDWGANWAAIVPLEETVNWRVVPDSAPDIAARVAGVEGAFWGEFTTRDAEMEPMLAPRILGLACKAWEKAESVDGKTLRGLAGHYAALFDRIGWARNRAA